MQDSLPYNLPNGMEVDLRQNDVELRYTDKDGEEQSFKAFLEEDGNLIVAFPDLVAKGVFGENNTAAYFKSIDGLNQEETLDALILMEGALEGELKSNNQWENVDIYIDDEYVDSASRDELVKDEKPKQVGMEM